MSRWMTYSFILGFAVGGCTHNTGEGGGCLAPDGREGACVKLVDCPSLFSIFERIKPGSAPPNATQILIRSLCINKTLVCCPGLQKESVLPEQCGISKLTDRVVSGKDASLGGWPWMVILKGRSGDRRVWFCGGSLISQRYVLTTAHCFSDPKIELLFARIGEYNMAQDPDCVNHVCAPSHQDIAVEKIIAHPSYNSTCKQCNDIALLRLSRPATMDRWGLVMPICLPRNLERDAGFAIQNLTGITGQLAWAAGWGSTDQDRSVDRIPDILQEVQLPIVDNPFCRLLKKDYPDPSMVFCAGGEGRDTCQGDSGGPLTIANSTTNEHILIGITSLGPRTCGSRHTSGLYTNVRHYMPWIVSSMMP